MTESVANAFNGNNKCDPGFLIIYLITFRFLEKHNSS